MNHMIIHLVQWLQQNPMILGIFSLIEIIRALAWCLKVFAKGAFFALDLTIKYQAKIKTFLKFLRNLAKTLSYVNAFLPN